MDPQVTRRTETEPGIKLRKPLDKMTPAELCEEAAIIRRGIEKSAERLNGIYAYLYTSVRRLPSDDMTYAYLSVANSGKRFSGMVIQASKRTAGTEGRALLLAKREIEERDRFRQVADLKRQAEEAKQKKAQARPTDPLEALFGVPLMPSEVSEPELSQSFIDDSQGPSSDLDDLYGEELT